MKKILVVCVAIVAFAFTASAQPKAIGARFGYGPFEISYEHYLGDPNFLEIELGGFANSGATGFLASGTYNFVFAQPAWTSRGTWAWYAGPGATVGAVTYKYTDGSSTSSPLFGIVGQVGLEYTFWFPLQLSVDIRPMLGFLGGEIWNPGLASFFVPTLSARYAF